jgi:hypothetical protein
MSTGETTGGVHGSVTEEWAQDYVPEEGQGEPKGGSRAEGAKGGWMEGKREGAV